MKTLLTTGWMAVLAAVPAARFLSPEPAPIVAPLGGFIGVYLDVTSEGLTISGIVPGSPAAAAGLSEGDRIVSLGDQEIASQGGLSGLLAEREAGDRIELGIVRDATALLGAAPDGDRGWLGVNLGGDGLTITSVTGGSAAADAGLQSGDRMLAIDGEAIDDFDELASRIGSAGPGTEIVVRVQRQVGLTLGTTPDERASDAPAPAEPKEPAKPEHPEHPEHPKHPKHPKHPAPPAHGPGFLGVELSSNGGGARIEAIVPDSPAQRAGLGEGDVILRIGAAPISSVEDVARAVAQAGAGAQVEIDILSHADGAESFQQVRAKLAARPGDARDPRPRPDAPEAPDADDARRAAEMEAIEARMRAIEGEMKKLTEEYERSMRRLHEELGKLGSRLGEMHSDAGAAFDRDYGLMDRLEDGALAARAGAKVLAHNLRADASELAHTVRMQSAEARERAVELAHEARTRAADLAARARDEAMVKAREAREIAAELATQAGAVAVDAGERAVEVADEARQRIADTLNDEVRTELQDLRAELETLRRRLAEKKQD